MRMVTMGFDFRKGKRMRLGKVRGQDTQHATIWNNQWTGADSTVIRGSSHSSVMRGVTGVGFYVFNGYCGPVT